MKTEKEIITKICELEIQENEILIEMMHLEYPSFSYRVREDRLTTVRERISDLKWVLN